jgi:hypothetical protein
MKYFIYIHGKEYGPYTIERLLNELRAGHIEPSTMAREEGSTESIEVSSILNISAKSGNPKLEKYGPLGCITVFSIVFFLLIFIAVTQLQSCFKGSVDKGTTYSTKRDKEREAQAMAKEFIKQKAKSPDSVKFHDVVAKELSENEFAVAGQFDAINSFNAKLRSKFVCVVKKTDGNWVLVELNIE